MTWHRRKELKALCREVLGQTGPEMEKAQAIEKSLGVQWEATQDVELFRYYDTPMYVYSCADCAVDFSIGYARATAQWLKDNMNPIITIVDYGCGIGASTRVMAEMLPEADVYGHVFGANSKKPWPFQAQVAWKLFEPHDNASLIIGNGWPGDYGDVPMHAHVACFFEELEHEKEPTAILKDAIDAGVVVLSLASSFTTTNDLGHWREYVIDGQTVDRKAAGRTLNRWLREQGFVNQETGFWNGRPAIWRKT